MLKPRQQFPDFFERLGGEDRARAIFRDLYDKLFADLLVGFFFAGKDKALLIERQLEFTARSLGANVAYHGKSMPEAHAPLPPILPGHFDRRHKLLADVLSAHGVDDELREAWLAYDKSFKRAVVR